MVRVGFVCLFIGLASMLISGEATAQSAQPWLDSPIDSISNISLVSTDTGGIPCSAITLPIELANIKEEYNACVYGSIGGTRAARYYDQENKLGFAISFSSELKFYEVRNFCVDTDYCLYSQSEDSALVQVPRGDGSFNTRFIANFSQKLKLQQQGGDVYFMISEDSPLLRESQPYVTRSATLSHNGKWAVVEIPGYGLIRLDMSTGQHRWMTTLGFANGTFSEDSINLAISNDGKTIATSGWYSGVTLYVDDGICGYQGPKPQVVEWCRSRAVDSQLLPGFNYGYALRFSENGKILSLNMESNDGLRKVFITPKSYGAAITPTYISFGDSFTSGEGELEDSFYLPETNSSTNRCHVSSRSYPYLLASYWEYLVTNHACSGSRTSDVRKKASLVLSGESKLLTAVSIGIGGNDVDLVGKLKSCLGPGTCEWAKQGNRAGTISEMKRLLPNLISLITDIQSNTSAPIFLVGYPLVINQYENAKCSLLINTLLSKEERQYIDESIRYLNRTLEAAAQFTDIAYANIEDSFQGERLCDISESSMNGVRTGDDIAPIPFLKDFKVIGAESFHPTPRGHQRIASMLEGKLSNFWESPTCLDCHAETEGTGYWTYGASLAQLLVTRFTFNFIESEQLRAGSKVLVEFPENTFAPNSKVKLEIHSTPTELTTLSTKLDGSLKAEISIPDEFEGYHSVHAFGKSTSNEDVDIYQTVYIEPSSNNKQILSTSIPSSKNKQTIKALSSFDNSQPQVIPQVLGLDNHGGINKIAGTLLIKNDRFRYEFLVYSFLIIIVLLIIITLLFMRKV